MLDYEGGESGDTGTYFTCGGPSAKPFGPMSCSDNGSYEWKWTYFERHALFSHAFHVTRWWNRDDFSLMEPFVVHIQREGSSRCNRYLMKERFVDYDMEPSGRRMFAWLFLQIESPRTPVEWEPVPRISSFEEMEMDGYAKVIPRKIAYEAATGLTVDIPFHWTDRSCHGFARVEHDYVVYPAQNKKRPLTPEEDVRMSTYNNMMLAYGYPASRIQIEAPVTIRRGEVPRYADIVVYDDDEHLRPIIVVECKRRYADVSKDIGQGQRYATILRAKFSMCTNGFTHLCHQLTDRYPEDAVSVTDIPRYNGLSSSTKWR